MAFDLQPFVNAALNGGQDALGGPPPGWLDPTDTPFGRGVDVRDLTRLTPHATPMVLPRSIWGSGCRI